LTLYLFLEMPDFDLDRSLLERRWRQDYAAQPEVPMPPITMNVTLHCLTIDEVRQRLAQLRARGARILEIFADDDNLLDLAEHMVTALAFATAQNHVPLFCDQAFAGSGT
jgi:hypothetical protein